MLAMWMSRDPLSFFNPALSKYGYVNNNPSTIIDPSGLIPSILAGCLGGFFGGGLGSLIDYGLGNKSWCEAIVDTICDTLAGCLAGALLPIPGLSLGGCVGAGAGIGALIGALNSGCKAGGAALCDLLLECGDPEFCIGDLIAEALLGALSCVHGDKQDAEAIAFLLGFDLGVLSPC